MASTDPTGPGPLAAEAQRAAERRDWVQACRLWTQCLQDFGSSVDAFAWRRSLGVALMEAGRYAEAEDLYNALAAERPAAPIGRLGLARLMQRQRRWAEALAHWDALILQSGQRADANWLVRRAVVLAELGRYDDAERELAACANRDGARQSSLVELALLAMRRAWWPEAFAWWETLRQESGGQLKPDHAVQRASVLAEMGRAREAEHLVRELRDDGKLGTHMLGRFAAILVRNQEWDEALTVLRGMPERGRGELPQLYADAIRARALSGCGRVAEAEPLYRDLAGRQPGFVPALCGLLANTGRHREALAEIERLAPSLSERTDLIVSRLSALIALRRMPEARAAHGALLAGTESPAVLQCLMDFTAPLFEGGDRRQVWQAIAERVEHIRRRRNGMPTPSLLVLRLRLLLAFRDYARYLAELDQVGDTRILGVCEKNMLAAARTLRSRPFPDPARPRVFGIGLSKTGTTSLAAALVELGYATLDWSNRLTNELICDDDLNLFDAFTDTPACMDFEKNYHRFPNSKFIHTLRVPADWQRSYEAHLKRHFHVTSFAEARERITDPEAVRHGTRFVEIYSSLYFSHPGYAEAFDAYDRRVRSFFADKPTERFLAFDLFAGDGWDKLCAFLMREVPSVPFPWENRNPGAGASDAAS